MPIEIKTFATGPLEVNTYVLTDTESEEAAVIDVGGNFDEIADFIAKKGKTLKFILNTHGHFDHILGEQEAQEKSKVPVLAHKGDSELIKNLSKSLLMFGIPPKNPPEITDFIDEESELSIGKNKIKIFHTPGHTPGGVCFLVDGKLFSGDTLFYGSVGRTDFEGGDFEQLKSSIREKLFLLDDATRVYPGHGATTTIGYEKKHNLFLR